MRDWWSALTPREKAIAVLCPLAILLGTWVIILDVMFDAFLPPLP